MAPYVTQGSGQQNTEACVRVFGVFVQKLVMVPIKKKNKSFKRVKRVKRVARPALPLDPSLMRRAVLVED